MGGWPVLAGSLISGIGGVLGAREQSQAADAAANESRRQFDISRGDALPYIETGHSALGKLRALSGVDGGAPDYSGFENSPDYLFAKEQGERSINRSLAARGKAISGEGVREGIRFAGGIASQNLNTYSNRLASLAGIGQTAGAQNAAVGANTAANVGAATIAGGNARSSGYAAAGNAAIGGLSNYLLMQQLARLQKAA